MRYDIIGDIHGHAAPLEALLASLGYWQVNGTWRHPDRLAVFVGDFVDRGPEQIRTLDIVRRMHDAAHAIAIMGNHEFNAIGFLEEDGQGGHLRPRNEKNRRQHRRLLEEVGEDTPAHREWVEWMKTLPLWMDLGDIRVVHACWSPKSMTALDPVVDINGCLTEDGIVRVNTKGTAEYEAAEIVLKGMELPLPDGCSFLDKDGTSRTNTRIAWWNRDATTFAASALVDDETRLLLPQDALPVESILTYDDHAPVFFGHYWLRDEPTIVTPKMACLDYSVAKDGVLCAYSYDGEEFLDESKLSWVSAHAPHEPSRKTDNLTRPR